MIGHFIVAPMEIRQIPISIPSPVVQTKTNTSMKLYSFTGKKRSYSGSFLYGVAIVVKLVAIMTSYWLISGDDWFMSWTGMEMDLSMHGIGTVYLGSLLMSLQVGILLYSLTHDYYIVGKRGQRQLLKASVFLWSPIQALFVWFRDYGYWMMSWEYGVMVVIDVMILVGCASKAGGYWANRLRPFREPRRRRKGDVESGRKGRKHRHESDSDSDSSSDSDSDSDSESDFGEPVQGMAGCRPECRCDCNTRPAYSSNQYNPSYKSSPLAPNQSASASGSGDQPRPKIRVDGQ